mgnify:CR=1 FL=1
MKIKNRDKFLAAYAEAVVDDMDLKTMCVYVQDCIEENYANVSDDDLIADVYADGDGPYEWLLAEHTTS